VFAVGAIVGGGYAANQHIRANLRRQVAAGITVLLALNGLSTSRDGQRACVESLRDPDAARDGNIDAAMRDRLARKHRRMAAIVGDDLPPAPGAPPANAASPPSGPAADALTRDLFKGDTATAREALLVGGLTLGDIVADAAAINPHVVNAADFSRQQDLDGLLAFGAFAEDVNALTGAAATGAHARLQGYVAEHLVATRLVEQGHQVTLPEDATQSGYDVVDGAPFQIKCADDPPSSRRISRRIRKSRFWRMETRLCGSHGRRPHNLHRAPTHCALSNAFKRVLGGADGAFVRNRPWDSFTHLRTT